MSFGPFVFGFSAFSLSLGHGVAATPSVPSPQLKPAYDLVVYGGTPAGIACAARAAREGLTVLLVNHTAHLGGFAANGLTAWDTLYDGARSPIFDETRQKIVVHYRELYGEGSPQYKAALPDPDRTNPKSRGLFEPHVAEKVLTGLVVEARNVTVLLNHYPAGVEIQDRKIQAYNYRPFLTRDPNRRRMPGKPAHYRRQDYLDCGRLYIGDGRQEINQGLFFNAPILVGENHGYPEANWEERRRIMDAHWDWCLGLLYLLQNDPAIPEKKRHEFSQWGLPKDEFVDNDNRPWELYVREARRLLGRAVFREQDARVAEGIGRAPIHADSITITEWPLDSLTCTKASIPGYPHEGKMNHNTFSVPGQVPFRSLLPKELDNLLVPTCLSATHVGWGSIRLEPVWMSTGEAAGWAAILACQAKILPGELDPEDLQRVLIGQGFLISYFKDAGAGSGKDWVPAVQWAGTKGFFSTYEAFPDAALNLPVAERWAETFAALVARSLDPIAEARKVHAVEGAGRTGRTDPAISAAQFLALLDASLKKSGLTGKVLDQPTAALNLSPSSPLTRGQACQLMERAVALALPATVPVSGRAGGEEPAEGKAP